MSPMSDAADYSADDFDWQTTPIAILIVSWRQPRFLGLLHRLRFDSILLSCDSLYVEPVRYKTP